MNPRVSPDGKSLVYVSESDGTINLGLFLLDSKQARPLTHFTNGEQSYTPVFSPDGKKVAFGYSIGQNETVAILDTATGALHFLPVPGDSRNPSFSPDGKSLYYSSDQGGIFNIYKYTFADGSIAKLTNVLGGAFYPAVDDSGRIAFSSYTSKGYKLALTTDTTLQAHASDSVRQTRLPLTASLLDDGPLHHTPFPVTPEKVEHPVYGAKPYHSTFTSLSLYPIVRIDNYNEHSKGIDVVKLGLYVASTDVLDKLSLMAGGTINRNMERDLFLTTEYRDKIPGLNQLGIEPALELDIYNISRKIQDYEFSLTKPNTIYHTDITYEMLEVDAFLKGTIVGPFNNEMKIGYSYARYNQNFGSWLDQEADSYKGYFLESASRSTYFISNILSFQFKHNGLAPTLDKDINPVGRSFFFRYTYEMNQYNPNDSGSYSNGFRNSIYQHYNFHRLELRWNEYIPLPIEHHTFQVTLYGGTILGPTVDDFFDFYLGGFPGMRGYSFYSLAGNEAASVTATYRFPISTKLDARFLQMYFKQLYGSIFYDCGNAWNGAAGAEHWKNDIGAELRLQAFSWYAFPTSIFVSGAYGLNSFTQSITNSSGTITHVDYGREWRFYLGVLFGFDINELHPRIR
jgi:hypothetical protein